MFSTMLQKVEEMDLNVERFARIERVMQEAMRPYKEIYEDKKKQTIQTKLSMFIKCTPKPVSSSVEATPSPASASVDTTPSLSPGISAPASPLPDLCFDQTYEESVDDPQPSTSKR